MPSEELTTMPEKNQAIPFPGSLRDYFAGQALAGLLASYANPGANCAPTSDVAANESYAYADAMLAERERTGANNG